MKKLILFLLFVSSASFAQGVRYDIPPILNSRGQPIANPNISLCTGLATINGTTCSIQAQSFTDITTATQCAGGTPVTLTNSNVCQATGDALGNAGFWLAPGAYIYCVTAPGATGKCYNLTVPVGVAAGGGAQFKTDPWFDIRQYGALCNDPGNGTGTDDTTAIQAAINAAHALGTNATVYVPAVQGCRFTSQLTVFNSITIMGPGGITENTPALVYTGTGATSAITGGATGVSNFTMKNLVVKYTSGSFTGVLLDLSSNQTGNQNYLEGVTLTGGNGAVGGGQNSASYLLSLASSIGTHLFNVHIGGGSNGVNLSNAFGTKIYFSFFETIYGKITNKYLDAGNTTGCSSCGFVGNVFEHFSATNSSIDLDCSGSGCFGSTFIDNFIGDFPNNWAGNVIKTPSAMIIAGNTFSGPTVGAGGTLVLGGANGMSFTGNYITSGGIWATAFGNMGGATNLNIIANAWSGTVTTFLSGTPTTGTVVDNSSPSIESHFAPILTATGSISLPGQSFVGHSNTGWLYDTANNREEITVAGNGMFEVDASANIIGRSNLVYGFSPGAPESQASNDGGLSRLAAGVMAFGNGTAANKAGLTQSGMTARLTSDFTDANAAGLQVITGLSFSLPALAANWSFHCSIAYSQATPVASDQFGVASLTTAPTNLKAQAHVITTEGATAAQTTGNSGNITTTTPTSIVTFTAVGAGEKPVELDGTLEASGSGASTLQFYVTNGTAADVIVIKRDSYCALTP